MGKINQVKPIYICTKCGKYHNEPTATCSYYGLLVNQTELDLQTEIERLEKDVEIIGVHRDAVLAEHNALVKEVLTQKTQLTAAEDVIEAVRNYKKDVHAVIWSKGKVSSACNTKAKLFKALANYEATRGSAARRDEQFTSEDVDILEKIKCDIQCPICGCNFAHSDDCKLMKIIRKMRQIVFSRQVINPATPPDECPDCAVEDDGAMWPCDKHKTKPCSECGGSRKVDSKEWHHKYTPKPCPSCIKNKK